MKHLYFVRHGESELNVERVFAGQTDTPLTDHGRNQARIAGKVARSYRFDLAVSSPLSRALETAQILAREIGYPVDKIIVNDIFKEHNMGPLTGRSWDEFDDDEFSSGLEGVETWEHLLERARAGLEFLQNQAANNILLVGHGTFARALKTAIDPSQKYSEPPNAKIVQLI